MKLLNYIDFEIVGAGVQALTLTTHLFKKGINGDELCVYNIAKTLNVKC